MFVGACGERPQSVYKTSKDSQAKLNIIGTFGKKLHSSTVLFNKPQIGDRVFALHEDRRPIQGRVRPKSLKQLTHYNEIFFR